MLLDKSAFLGGNSTKATSGINGACHYSCDCVRLAADLSFVVISFFNEEIETTRKQKTNVLLRALVNIIVIIVHIK